MPRVCLKRALVVFLQTEMIMTAPVEEERDKDGVDKGGSILAVAQRKAAASLK